MIDDLEDDKDWGAEFAENSGRGRGEEFIVRASYHPDSCGGGRTTAFPGKG